MLGKKVEHATLHVVTFKGESDEIIDRVPYFFTTIVVTAKISDNLMVPIHNIDIF